MLSHETSLSAGVAILFSLCVSGQPVMIEIMLGRNLHLDITLGETSFTFLMFMHQVLVKIICKLSDALLQCPQVNVVFMQGDFNCTINSVLDRNHDEPHPLSAGILKKSS